MSKRKQSPSLEQCKKVVEATRELREATNGAIEYYDTRRASCINQLGKAATILTTMTDSGVVIARAENSAETTVIQEYDTTTANGNSDALVVTITIPEEEDRPARVHLQHNIYDMGNYYIGSTDKTSGTYSNDALKEIKGMTKQITSVY